MGKVVDRWTPEGLRLQNSLSELKKIEVGVGFIAGEANAKKRDKNGKINPTDLDIVQVAAWNELGTSKIPARPFMQQTLDNNEDVINAFTDALIGRVIDGSETVESAANSLGAKVKGLMQQEIRNGEFAPNAPSTIRKKGSSHPLIDTGTMRQSVTYVVRKKRGIGWSSGRTIK